MSTAGEALQHTRDMHWGQARAAQGVWCAAASGRVPGGAGRCLREGTSAAGEAGENTRHMEWGQARAGQGVWCAAASGRVPGGAGQCRRDAAPPGEEDVVELLTKAV